MAVLAASLAALLQAGAAQAAACCVSATSFGIGRLLPWEDAAAGVLISHGRSVGQLDEAGHFQRLPYGESYGISQVEPWVIARVHERAELQMWSPFLWEDRSSSDQHQFAGGLGDVGSALRMELTGVGEYDDVPALSATVGVVAPTGTRVEHTEAPLFAGTTGRGAWTGSASVAAEFAQSASFASVEAGLQISAPADRPGGTEQIQFGNRFNLGATAGHALLGHRLVLAVAATHTWARSTKVDGTDLAGSSARELVGSVSASWRLNSMLSWTNIVSNSTWPSGFARNQDGRVSFTTGIRIGVSSE